MTAKATSLVGLDVHARQTHAAILQLDSGELAVSRLRMAPLELVRLLAAGEPHFAFVPSVEDESFGDLIRCIDDLRGDLMRARHRLSKFLLRRGHRYEDGHAWTSKHARWLRSLAFEGCAQATFAAYCASVELLAGRRATLVTTLEQTVPSCSHAPTIGRLRCFPWDRDADRRRPVRRDRRLSSLPPADDALRVPRDRPLRADL